MEITGFNSSYQAPVTVNYIYYDTYILFTGLEEKTDYILYFVIRDLSGNLGDVYTYPFRTLKKQLPCLFKIKFRQEVSNTTLLNTFGLITSKTKERFMIVSKPPKFTIKEADEPQVLNIIKDLPVTYEFILLQNITSEQKRPIETVSLLQFYKNILLKEIPSLDTSFNINQNAHEISYFRQEF